MCVEGKPRHVDQPSYCKNMNGYRLMIWDRCPKIVRYALVYCEVKTKWVDHVYRSYVGVFKNAKDRSNAVKITLGIHGKKQDFDFERTIDWDNLSEDEGNEWKRIESWITWFKAKHAYIENAYSLSKSKGKPDDAIKTEICKDYLSGLDEDTQTELYEFLKKTFSL